jgi:hypothetical protein
VEDLGEESQVLKKIDLLFYILYTRQNGYNRRFHIYPASVLGTLCEVSAGI